MVQIPGGSTNHIGDVNVISCFLIVLTTLNIFEAQLGKEIEKAYTMQQGIKTRFVERTENLKSDYEICSSIIFPELVRHSLIRNKIEDFLLLNFYTTYGSGFSNKSVGLFQMKPKFIEKLEKSLQESAELERFSFIWSYPKNLNKKEIRRTRANRMLDLNWQIDYVISFVALMEVIHSNKNMFFPNSDKSKKIAFFASSYNSGYWYDVEKISYFENQKLFPSGLGSRNNLCSYSDVSIYHYKQIIKNKTERAE